VDLKRRVLFCLAVALACGCTRTPPPAGTGAAAAARTYFEALVRRDWPAAYAALHPDSRARCDPDRFARLAEAERRRLGFEPEAVRLRSCTERGGKAVAHVVFNGRAGGKQRTYRDAVGLRRAAAGWGVVLPGRFGS
jgi:hypothetical protein